MRPQSFFADRTSPIVADASAVINITASAHAGRILKTIPNPFLVPDVVVSELESGSNRGRTNAEQLHKLINDHLVEVITLGDTAEFHFEELVVGPAKDTLDDGEAATIACAVEIGALPLINERKARSICSERYPNLPLGCTTDVFKHPEVGKALGQADLTIAVLNALKDARMHVLPHHLDWVFNLIGPENAATCKSLPRAIRVQASADKFPGSD